MEEERSAEAGPARRVGLQVAYLRDSDGPSFPEDLRVRRGEAVGTEACRRLGRRWDPVTAQTGLSVDDPDTVIAPAQRVALHDGEMRDDGGQTDPEDHCCRQHETGTHHRHAPCRLGRVPYAIKAICTMLRDRRVSHTRLLRWCSCSASSISPSNASLLLLLFTALRRARRFLLATFR